MTWDVIVSMTNGDIQTIRCDVYHDALELIKELTIDMMFGFVDPEAMANFDEEDLIFYRHYGYGLEPRTNDQFAVNPTEIISVEIWGEDQ